MGGKGGAVNKTKTETTAIGPSNLASAILEAHAVLRSISISRGLQHPTGGGVWALLSILLDRGSLTIRDAAIIRGVSRQYMIKLANQLETEGVLTLERDGPERRGFQMHLTAKGRQELARARRHFEEFLADRTTDMSIEKIRVALEVLIDFTNRLAHEP